MSTLLFFSDSSRTGYGATIRLHSGEPCLLSIAPAQSWVRVKKSRHGIFGPLLYSERRADRTALTARALRLQFPDNLLPAGFKTPILCVFANAILHCASCAEVSATLKKAIARAEQQAIRDKKVIADFAALMAADELKAAVFHDASVLPHPKETIIRAIEREIVREPLDARVEWLKVGAGLLPTFPDRETLVGELHDLSLDHGRVLAMPSNVASTLHSVQSGVSPRSQNSDAGHTKLAWLIAMPPTYIRRGMEGTMFRDNLRKPGGVRRLGLLIGLVLALGGCGQLASQQPPVQAPLKLPPL